MHMTEDAKRIIDDSIRAVLPDAAVYRALEGRRFDRPVTVIAIGKAGVPPVVSAQTGGGVPVPMAPPTNTGIQR